MTAEALAAILRRSPAILLDFDGPVCSVFAGYPAAQIAEELRGLVSDLADSLPTALESVSSPHDFLTITAEVAPELARDVEDALQTAEVKAVESATPTPGAEDFLAACKEAGRQLAIVSNNTEASVRAYLARMGLTRYVQHIEARDPSDPGLMKPHPYLIEQAAQALVTTPVRCTLIGDQTTDIRAAKSIGAASIGYANKPGKSDDLTGAGADAIIDRISELTAAMRAV